MCKDKIQLKLVRNNKIIGSYDINEKILKELQKKYEDRRYKIKSKVRCIETGMVFKSANLAQRYLSLTNQIKSSSGEGSQIRKCCKGEREQAYNYHWEFTDDEVTKINFRELYGKYRL